VHIRARALARAQHLYHCMFLCFCGGSAGDPLEGQGQEVLTH
jgi:hypothetical protein